VHSAPVAAPPTGAEAPRPVDQPLAVQLLKPVAALRAAGDGNHVITIAVTPENLGPVVVRAHVSGDAIRIELVAPTEQSREALKAIMPDLRRDLSQSGGQLSLDLSSGNQPSGRESFGGSADRARPRDFEAPAAAASTIRTHTARTESALDVLV
jgi:flagellar hook-length control protein FliK